MGWNSYTGYSTAAPEDEFLRNVDALAAKLLPFGYDTAVVDSGWFLDKPHAEGGRALYDEFGRPEASDYFFPSGLAHAADYAHERGLKFGIWLIRGVDRRAAEENLPVEGTDLRLQDIVDRDSLCSWNDFNYGVDMTKPGAQAYYDGMLRKYAAMGVDFIKYDDIVPHPAEVDAVVEAIGKCGCDIVLSLSPGDHIKVEDSAAYMKADMVRITSDIWDNRASLETTFGRWEEMQDYDGPVAGSWLDLDMVCFGRLMTTVDGGRDCRFTDDQKRTFMIQRALAASPLMLGGVLYEMDEFSMSLFTHPDILRCNQNGVIGRLVHRDGPIDVWRTAERESKGRGWIGVFNRDGERACVVKMTPEQLGLGAGRKYTLTDIWTGDELPASGRHAFDIPPDGVAFLRYEEAGERTG
jgi:hypothetical protein